MKISDIRKQRGISQLEMAARTDLSQATISRAESGDDGTTLRTLRLIARDLDVPLWELFADDRTRQELLLLEAYRGLDEARQQGWLEMAQALAQARAAPTG